MDDWDVVRQRYADGAVLPALAGDSQVSVTGADDTAIYFRQRLWSDRLTRQHLAVALRMLQDGPTVTPMAFGERLRTYFSAGPDVQPGCSRIPNLATLVLRDLGHFDSDGRASVTDRTTEG